jgi:hypothetical protein
MASMNRYRIETSKEALPGETRLLRRAFARAGVNWAHIVTGVEVSCAPGAAGGGFVIVIHAVGSPARAAIECERLFAAAWYDAFGARGNNHIGSLLEDPSPSPRHRQPVAA